MMSRVAVLLLAMTAVPAAADDQAMAFVDGLAQKLLVGSFTTETNRPAATVPMKTDRYRIADVRHVGGDQFVVEARITYGTNDVTVPVPVTVKFAGETPVLSLDKLKIPLLGEDFGAKILFDFEANRYAGTWRHGDVGGTMWGRITEPPADEPADSE